MMAEATTLAATNWPVVAGVLALFVLWWWLRRGRAPRARHRAPDALDAGTAPATRNQALIDAPSAAGQAASGQAAAQLASTGPDIMGGMGEVIALGVAREVAATQQASGDDLTRIKGLGPKLAARLAELGVVRFAQIAAWGPEELAALDAQLGSFAGRPARDNWVEQAGFLSKGDAVGYEARFGKL